MRGGLELDGVDLSALAAEHGTPLWAISRSTLERNYDTLLGAYRSRYPQCEIAFSMKAHDTLAVLRLLHGRGARLDCSAEYELEVAMGAGVPASDIVLNGSGKSDTALHAAARHGVRQVNVDSLDEARRLAAIADELGTSVDCAVRVQLGYETLLRLDPSYETSASAADKFGSSVAGGEAMAVVDAIVESPALRFRGLHHHIVFPGYMSDYSADRALAHHHEAVGELCRFALEVERTTGAPVERLNLGGGVRAGGSIHIAPLADPNVSIWHDLPSADEFAAAIFDPIDASFSRDSPPLVQFESGGHMVWDAVLLLTEVSEVKQAARRGGASARYVFVDTSAMMFVIRSMLRMAHPVLVVDRPLAEIAAADVELAGQTCLYDTIARRLPLPEVERGDLLCLLHQGAYCETTSTQVNSFPRPEVVLLDAGLATVVKRRETLADVHARDVIPAGL